ncbi:MAG: serine hydrolase, partial [Singulisphaera sp.]
MVGIIDGDERSVFGYGRGPADAGAPPDEDTIYEIGSITKVFTTLSLAKMVEEGKVRLDDPVRLHLPDDVKVPERGGKEIRLVDLATHTSGLPRIPGKVALIAVFDRNPYASYRPSDLYAFLGS